MKVTRVVGGLLLALAPAMAAPQAGGAQGKPDAPIKQRTLYEDLQMLSGVLNQIRVNHPDSVDQHRMILAAIEAMVHEADPHSFLMPYYTLSPEKQKAREEGKLYPVPIDFAYISGAFVVVSVAPGTDARQLDILPGDELIAIDSVPLTAQSASELEVQLTGDKNSTVKLTLERQRSDGSTSRVSRTVKRQRPEEASAVPAAFLLDAQTGYVRVSTFLGEKVASDLHASLGMLEGRGMKRLVLDLRDNGGGSVAEAARVAGEFLPKGTIVYTAEGRKKDLLDTGRVSRSFWSHERRYPIVLLVNRGTASASELVAGALQDHDRALVVGRRSFGKSLEMLGFPLADGSVLEMVVGHLRTPCGRIIQRQYRGLSRREYYRRAGAERDTLGQPTCKTDGGRVVYGGGGIYPDVPLPDEPLVPAWMSRLDEENVLLKWVGAYLSDNPTSYPSLDAFASNPLVGAEGVADFRRFAATQQVTVPAGADVDSLLARELALVVASAKWSEAGYYRIEALLDADVRAAVAAFDKAAAILPQGK
jgi:carboxyl-terminal processing protease